MSLHCHQRLAGSSGAGTLFFSQYQEGSSNNKYWQIYNPTDAEIDLAFDGNNGLARKGNVTLVMRLIEGEFPNYSQVLPKKIERHVVTFGQGLEPTAFNRVKELLMKGVP